MAVRAKHFDYWITLEEDGKLSADGEPVDLREEVSAEHLLLAALARCSLSSLSYFARQKGLQAHGSAFASGTVTRRADDDRYGFTNFECRMEIELEGEIPDAELRPLLESAEWGCFVGASLNPAPRYQWRVNGRSV
ncbi:MAG TPA: OsmC family protein [Gaiellaceae bacterium]|nr:OsmC family protein [Gaiellaceae bacterium]